MSFFAPMCLHVDGDSFHFMSICLAHNMYDLYLFSMSYFSTTFMARLENVCMTSLSDIIISHCHAVVMNLNGFLSSQVLKSRRVV